MTIPDVRAMFADQLGISENDARYPGNIDPEIRVKLFGLTNQYVKEHPEQFSATQVGMATKNFETWGTKPLEDSTFQVGDFVSETVDNGISALEDVSQVGKGFLSTFRMGSWLIPLAAIAVVGILLWSFYLKQTSK